MRNPHPTLIFHSAYTKISPTINRPIILRSSDDICFHFCLAVLSRHLAFFANLRAERKTRKAVPGIISLSCATAPALHLLTHVIMEVDGCHPADQPKLTLRLVREVSRMIKAHDLVELVPMVSRVYNLDTWTQLALASATANESLAVSLAEELCKSGARMADMPPFAREILEELAPSSLDRLGQLERRRWDAWASLPPRMDDTPMHDEQEDFADECKERPCATLVAFRGDFEQFRWKTSKVAWEIAKSMEHEPTGRIVRAVSEGLTVASDEKGVHCPRCHQRIMEMIERAILLMRETMPTRI